MTTQQTPQRKDGHLTVYWLWPTLAAITIAVILAVSIAGVTLFLTSFDWQSAGVAGGVTFFALLGIGTAGMFLFVIREWRGPAQVERLEVIRQEVIDPQQIIVESEPRFIPVKPRGIVRNAPQLPEGANGASVRRGMRAAVDLLASSIKRRQGLTTMAAEAPTIEPLAIADAAPWVVEFHDILMGMWSQKLTRTNFERTFPGGQALYKKYLAGTGTRHADRGLWVTWGIVSRGSDARGTWEFCHDLPTILALDPALDAYAKAQAGLVQHSPEKTDIPEKTVFVVPEMTQTKKPTQKPKWKEW